MLRARQGLEVLKRFVNAIVGEWIDFSKKKATMLKRHSFLGSLFIYLDIECQAITTESIRQGTNAFLAGLFYDSYHLLATTYNIHVNRKSLTPRPHQPTELAAEKTIRTLIAVVPASH